MQGPRPTKVISKLLLVNASTDERFDLQLISSLRKGSTLGFTFPETSFASDPRLAAPGHIGLARRQHDTIAKEATA